MKTAAEHIFTGTTQAISSYDSTKTLLGTLIKQYSLGSNAVDKFVSPLLPLQSSLVDIAGQGYTCPYIVKWSDRYRWVFLADNASAALTRRIAMYEYDTTGSALSYKGYITLNFSALTGNKTSRDLCVTLHRHISGTVSTSGSSTTINGSSTQFTTDRIAVGARIGFGSTDATQITTWYDITAITNDTTLTIGTAVTLAGGTPYVIEELRVVYVFTNATTTNGGVALVKGLNASLFTLGGTSISEASATDNVRAVYFLKDSATTNMTIAYSTAVDTDTSTPTSQDCYILNADAAATARIYYYNLRAALTVSSGQSTSAFVHRTGQQVVTGNIAAASNLVMCTPSHGTASGVKSLLFVTASRICRCAVSAVTNGSTTFVTDSSVEVPPGTTTTHAASANLANISYSAFMDRFVITTATAPFRLYLTQYDASGSTPCDKVFAGDTSRLRGVTTDSDAPNAVFCRVASLFSNDNGIGALVLPSTTAGINVLTVFPFAADGYRGSYSNQRVITPSIALTNATKLYRAYLNIAPVQGDTGTACVTQPVKLYYRTSGITDNSGSWTALDSSGDLTGVTATSAIQFMLEFSVLGETCIPSRVHSVCCVYEDGSQDSHYLPSLAKSSASSRIFAWRQATAWGSSIPNMRIRLYNADTALLVLDDNVTSSASGVWEYSTNGTSWSAWSSAADAVGNYIRYTATTLPSNIVVRALLTQA